MTPRQRKSFVVFGIPADEHLLAKTIGEAARKITRRLTSQPGQHQAT